MEIEKFVLNETSYFGEKARDVLPEEIKKRNLKCQQLAQYVEDK